ncbi:MAG: hypothetical protein AAFR51_08915 [Pseudomonadota bacterium]
MNKEYRLRVAKRRQVNLKPARLTPRDIRDWIMFGLAIVGTLVAVMGVILWITESPDRQWEREVRRATLAETALSMLNKPDGDIVPTASVQRAIFILNALNEPVEITGKNINLAGMVLPCGSYRIAGESVTFDMTSVSRAYLLLKSPKVSINASMFWQSEVIARTQGGLDLDSPPVGFRFSRAWKSNFMFEDGAELMFSTFEQSRTRTWLGEIHWKNASIFEPIALPSYSNTKWHSLDEKTYADFFDPNGVSISRTNAKEYPASLSPGADFLTEQRYSHADVETERPDIAEAWKPYCTIFEDKLTCERSEPRYFEKDSIARDTIGCSDRNDYKDFDPELHGDEPIFKRSHPRP